MPICKFLLDVSYFVHVVSRQYISQLYVWSYTWDARALKRYSTIKMCTIFSVLSKDILLAYNNELGMELDN